MNKTQAENFIRSATAPEIRAGVMMANIIWNTMNSRTSPSTPLSPRKSSPPMKLADVGPKAMV